MESVDSNIEKTTFHRNTETAAKEEERDLFWKKLRHFYRTGEKQHSEEFTYRSALISLLEDENKYPFELDDTSLKLDEKTPFKILSILFAAHQKENRRAFKSQLSDLIDGLHKLLNMEDRDADSNILQDTYDFANEMIAFDKMVNMTPKDKDNLSKERADRLQKVISSLKEGLDIYKSYEGTVVYGIEYDELIKSEELFADARHIKAQEDVFQSSLKAHLDEMNAFASLVKAVRVAKLEIGNEYEESIHDEYFDHFTWFQLSKEELNLFKPILVMVSHKYTMEHLTSFSQLLGTNQAVNIFVVNDEVVTAPSEEFTWEVASHQVRQELAALAIAHRNVYTFQSNMAHPEQVVDGMKSCLKTTLPSLCHLSVPKEEPEVNQGLIARAENYGRYFPNLTYDPGVDSWQSRLDYKANEQPEESWPLLSFKLNMSDDNSAEQEVRYTYADYKAIYPEKAEELMIIPSRYENDKLIALSEYLTLEEDKLYGKIPYIWVADDNNELHKAAVPNVWVVSCQERLDYWEFIRGFGSGEITLSKEEMEDKGFDSPEVQEYIEKRLKEESEKIYVKAQEEAVAKAAEGLIGALLADDDLS